jgi:hypothetical protein
MHVLLDDDLGRLTVRRVSPWHRLLARVLAASLDRQLASGARPEGSAVLAARAMTLTSAGYRRALAASLRRVLAASGAPAPHSRPLSLTAARSAGAALRPYVPLRRDRIAGSAAELAGLAERLAARGPVAARGVALVSQLLADGAGPLYRVAAREDLAELIEQASEALLR